MNVKSCLVLIAGALSLGACASMPDAKVSYYLPKAETRVQVLQTIACNEKKDLVIGHDVSQVTEFKADTDRARGSVRLKDVDGTFSTGEFTFVFTEDNRLKSVNASSTGKGEDIVKAAMTLASSAALVLGGPPSPTPTPCEYIALLAKDKPITLKYFASTSYGAGADEKLEANPFAPTGLPALTASQDFMPEGGSEPAATFLKDRLPVLKLRLKDQTEVPAAALYEPTDDKFASLTMTRQQRLLLEVVDVRDSANPVVIWTQAVTVPNPIRRYDLRVPQAKTFGKQTFAMVQSDSGALTTLTYTKEPGAAGAANALNAGLEPFKPETDTARAAALKAEADVILQQQRLINCKAKPAECK